MAAPQRNAKRHAGKAGPLSKQIHLEGRLAMAEYLFYYSLVFRVILPSHLAAQTSGGMLGKGPHSNEAT